MAVDAAQFRAVLGQWPTGVTVVTTLADGVRHGMTASSFSSVSLDPPLVSVCLAKSMFSHDLVAASGTFAVSILAKDQAHIGKRFARFDPTVGDRFDGESWETAKTGAPVLGDALGWLDCSVLHTYPGGDHTIFIGEVLAAGTPRVTSPLLYHSRTWGQFADALADEVLLTDPSKQDIADLRVCVGRPQEVEQVMQQLQERADLHARPRVLVDDAFAIAPSELGAVVAQLAPLGPAALVLVDAGTAGPIQVREACREAVLNARPVTVGVRLSAERGLVQANLLTALKSGVAHVDVGPGGTPLDEVTGLASALGLAVIDAGTAR